MRGATTWQNLPGAEVWLSSYGGGPSASAATNSAALQAILDAYPSGVKVLCNSGTHQFATAGTATGDALTQPYCVRLSASHGPVTIVGTGATTFKLADAQTANTSIILARGSSGAYRTSKTLIDNIEFDGNGTNQTGSWDDFGLVTAAYAKYVTIRDCYLHDAKIFAAHPLRDAQAFAMLSCRVPVTAASTNTVFYEVPRGIVRDCLFEGVNSLLTPALTLGCNADVNIPGQYYLVTGNDFYGGGQMLSMAGVQHSVVTGNIFHDQVNSNGTALIMDVFNHATNDYDTLENAITDNVFRNVRRGIVLAELDATFGCKRNVIANNVIVDGPNENLTYGILEGGSAGGHVANYIHDNIIQGASTAAISTQTAIVKNNVVNGTLVA